MKNHLKKLVCLLVIISTVFALSVSAFAFDTAISVNFDQVVYDSITDADKDDCYKFTLTGPGKALIGFTTGMRYYTLTVYNENKDDVWTKSVNINTNTDSVVYETCVLDPGSYYLKITGVGDGLIPIESTGNYNFKLTYKYAVKQQPETDTDINNSLAAAKAILLETTTAGKLLKEDEEDFYQFVVPSSGTLEFDMTAKLQYYCAYLLDANGNRIWSSEKNEWDSATKQRKDNHKLDLTAGTYYLLINGYRSSTKILKSTGNYQFALYFTPAGETTVEPNNSLVEAKKINLDTLVVGHLAINDGRDFFEINVASGELAIAFVSNMSSYNVHIYDEYGKEKWSSKDNKLEGEATSRKDLHEVSLDAGKYYISVTGSTGKYNFVLAKDTALATVKTIKYKKTVSSITLNWTSVAGAEGYDVYKYDEEKKEFVKVGSTTKNTIKIKKLKSGTDYDFKIKAYKKLNGCEIYSDFSEEKATTTMPAKAVISKVTAGTKSATVVWNKVEGASGYRVFYSRTKDFDEARRIKVKDGETTERVIQKLKKGKKYYFKVRAYKTFNGKNLFGALSKRVAVKVK